MQYAVLLYGIDTQVSAIENIFEHENDTERRKRVCFFEIRIENVRDRRKKRVKIEGRNLKRVKIETRDEKIQ